MPKILTALGLILTLANNHVVFAASFMEFPDLTHVVESQGLVVPKDPEHILIVPEVAPTLRMVRTTLSAYNSIPNQTDGSPFVTAAGTCVRDGVVASNAFRIGTKIRFPELFGNKVFVVEDRMNERYTNRIDVWMTELGDARKFGLKRNTRVEVVEEGNGKKFWKDGWTNEKCVQMLADSVA
ncbi:3D domain-containing protein [Candidatus Uhrbacteria bacterium]|nr:3D domain-containing protein [Candidatus Uhrbacteria bacterium]